MILAITAIVFVIFIISAVRFPEATFKVVSVLKWIFIALAIYGFYQEPELLEYAVH